MLPRSRRLFVLLPSVAATCGFPSPASSQPAPEPASAPAPEPPASEVTVVGARVARTPGSAHIVNKKQLERAEYDDAGAILQQVPGVYVRQEDGAGLRPNLGIRGANPDRSKKLTLMEDGLLFGPAPYSAPAAYYFPLMTRMTALRVVKGPSAVAYGPQTVGGAVDFISRPIPAKPSAAFDVGYGEYGYTKGHGWFGASDGQVGFLVEGVRLHNEGFKELASGGDTGSTRSDWMAKLSYVLEPSAARRNQLELKLGYAEEVSNETYLGLTDADFRSNPDLRYPASELDQMQNHRTALALTHELDDPGAELKLRTTLYRHDYQRVWRKVNQFAGTPIFDVLRNPADPTNAGYLAVLRAETDSGTAGESILIGPNDRAFVSQGVQSVLEHRRTTGPVAHRAELGTRLHYDEVKRRHSQDGFLVVQGELFPDGSATEVTASGTDSSHALALHAIDAMTWKNITLTPGVRVEMIRSVSVDRLTAEKTARVVTALMPGVGVFGSIWESFGVLAGVYRGFSPPPPGSDEQIKPEYSLNYEAGARYSRAQTRVELIGFYNDYSNLTDVCTLSSGCLDDKLDRQFDAGQARIYGAEAFAAHELSLGPSVKLPLSFAYTHTRATFESSFQSQDPIYGNVTLGDEIPYVPKHQLNASLGLELARAGGYVTLGYVSPMREEAGQQPLEEALTTDEQLWVDVGAQVRVLGPAKIYGNLRNALNARDIVSRRPYGARPNAPRWLQVGAKIEL